MRFLGALALAAAVFLAIATATGHAESLRIRLPGHKRSKPSRQVWLRQAGVKVTPAQFWGVSAAAAVVVETACWGIGGSWVVGVVPALAAGLGPRAYFGRRRAARLSAVTAEWPQGIRDLLAAVQSRQTLHHAIVEMAATGPEALREAFADYEALSRLGGPVAALTTIRSQLADAVSDRMIELLIVAHDEGQALTLQILREQAVEVAEDLRTTAEIHSAQNEPRIVASAAFAMPWVGLVVICAGVKAYRSFYGTSGGVLAVVIAGTMSMTGLLVARRLIRESAEPRVLGEEGS